MNGSRSFFRWRKISQKENENSFLFHLHVLRCVSFGHRSASVWFCIHRFTHATRIVFDYVSFHTLASYFKQLSEKNIRKATPRLHTVSATVKWHKEKTPENPQMRWMTRAPSKTEPDCEKSKKLLDVDECDSMSRFTFLVACSHANHMSLISSYLFRLLSLSAPISSVLWMPIQ